jgi:hypothetical protein
MLGMNRNAEVISQWHLHPLPKSSSILSSPPPSQHFPEHLDHFVENMEDFSNDLFSSFFDDPVLDEKSPLLDMELDSPTPGIQAEHSYSLSGDSAPQSPLVPIKMEDTTQGKRWTAQAQKTQEGGSF